MRICDKGCVRGDSECVVIHRRVNQSINQSITSHRKDDNRAKILEHKCSAARAPRNPNRALPKDNGRSSHGWKVRGVDSGGSGVVDDDADADADENVVGFVVVVVVVVDVVVGSANRASFR